jgi:DNA invertase Pin-like site-specific DNA recombinase
LKTLAEIGAANATFRSLHDAWADTTTPHGGLIVTVLGGLAEFERHLIVTRTSEGRKLARANCVMFGRPRKLTPHQCREAIAHRDTDEETLTAVGNRPQLQRQPFNDQPLITTGPLFLRRGVSRRPE